MGEPDIIFFDGICGLCNRTVDFVLREDREENFLYSPLQGETFKCLTRNHPEALNADSIFVLRRGQKEILLQRSDAFLYILENLPRYRGLALIGKRFPKRIRDSLYRLIAATRYRIWGQLDSCRIPSPEEKAKFLP
jgi:predicted DCC family thiol-disulfide oxidoreductase YuxK